VVALGKTISRGIFASAAAAAWPFFVTTSLAADVAGVMPLKAPAIGTYAWSGFYVGGNVGYSRGHGSNTSFNLNPTTLDSSFGSLFDGIQFGYNYRPPSRLLVGVEGDFWFPNFLDDGIVASREGWSRTPRREADGARRLRRARQRPDRAPRTQRRSRWSMVGW
jgi:hypothetical protein